MVSLCEYHFYIATEVTAIVLDIEGQWFTYSAVEHLCEL